MTIQEALDRDRLGDIFSHVVQPGSPSGVMGIRPGDCLTVSRTKKPTPASVVVLSSDECAPFHTFFKYAAEEVKNGAQLLGTAIHLSRDLTEGGCE